MDVSAAPGVENCCTSITYIPISYYDSIIIGALVDLDRDGLVHARKRT